MYVRPICYIQISWRRCICFRCLAKKAMPKFDLILHFFSRRWQAHAFAHSMQWMGSSMVFKWCFSCFFPFNFWVVRLKKAENHHTLKNCYWNISSLLFWKDFLHTISCGCHWIGNIHNLHLLALYVSRKLRCAFDSIDRSYKLMR